HASAGAWGNLDCLPFHSRVPSTLTTPVAFISSIPFDVFDSSLPTGCPFDIEIHKRFRYWSFPFFVDAGLNPAPFQAGNDAAGDYLFYSIGPDQDQSNLGASFYVNYDPTNGTVSQGNIFRGQKNPEAVNNALAPG